MKDFEKDLLEVKNNIENSQKNNPDEIYQYCKAKKQANIFNWRLFYRLGMCILLLISILLSTWALIKYNNLPNNPNNPNHQLGENQENDNKEKKLVYRVTSEEELKKLLSEKENNYYFFDESLDAEIMVPGNDSSGDIYKETSSSSYQTNIQVEGIDEEDIVKVNGDYIYYLPKTTMYNKRIENKFYILKYSEEGVVLEKTISFPIDEENVEENETHKILKTSSFNCKSLYATDKYIILLGNVTVNVKITKNGTNNTYTTNYENYYAVNIYDINTYELISEIKIPGTNVSTRLTEDKLYIINNYMENEDYYLPMGNFNENYISPKVEDIYYCPSFGSIFNNYLIIYKIDLRENIELEEFYFLSPYINNLYMDEDTLYLIKSYNNSEEIITNTKGKNWNSTQILIIDLNDGISIDGIIKVKGSINDKYCIDEYNGYLRIATTGNMKTFDVALGKIFYNYSSEVFNYLTIFGKNNKGNWEEVGSITEGIGLPGEKIKSARFDGNNVTIVTFKQTDPLYYIDLADPKNPVITSKLKVTGYSAYQHPYKDNYIIGIGYSADLFGRTNGIKISLYDISDKDNIKEVGNSLVFKSTEYSSASVISDPKAIMFNLSNNCFGFSMNGMQLNQASNKYEWANGYFVFNIDETKDTPISIYFKDEITSEQYKYSNEFQRMVYIKDKYFLLKRNEVVCYFDNGDGFDVINKIELN